MTDDRNNTHRFTRNAVDKVNEENKVSKLIDSDGMEVG